MAREIQSAEAEHAEDVVIDVFLNAMKGKLDSTCAKSSPSFTICRVPATIRKSDPAAYDPRIISIGPFHRGRENLTAMEEHKWRYLDKVLRRSKPENDLEKYLKEMKAKESQARNCYSENFTMDRNEFIEMMVLDGCFVIQIIHEQNNHVETDDPIYRNVWMFNLILNDMLLLENQLPFFVLECLWELIGQPRATLRKKALTFFRPAFPDKLELKCPEEPDIHHLLHAVHLSFRPAPQSMSTATGKLSCLQLCKDILLFLGCLVEPRAGASIPTSQQSLLEDNPPCSAETRDTSTRTSQQSLAEHNRPSMVTTIIPGARELQEAGLRFKRKEKASSFIDVTFEKGWMNIPYLSITDDTNALFRNFIAFEQCFTEWGNYFTTYCFLIDALVNTRRDVSILSQSNIIEHMLGSDKEVALLFNKLCKEIVLDPKSSYLANVFKEVNDYTQDDWPKWRAKLVRDYFSNPWAIISLIAATILLIVALVGTFFTVYSYFRPSNS